MSSHDSRTEPPERRRDRNVGLRGPVPGDGTAVPTANWTQPLWRAQAYYHVSPWFYKARSEARPGRFDLPAPHGTCYWSASPDGAVREQATNVAARDRSIITEEAVASLLVWRADMPDALAGLADTTTPSLPYLTDEIATIVPYELPWRWAEEFHAVGRLGILYRGRFAREECVALFGSAGLEEVDSPAAVPAAALESLSPMFRAQLVSRPALADLARPTPQTLEQ